MTRAYTLQDVLGQLNNQGTTQVDYSVTAQINNVYVGIDSVGVAEGASSLTASIFYPLVIVEDACPVVYFRLNEQASIPWDSNATGLKNVPTNWSNVTQSEPGFNAAFGGSTVFAKSSTSNIAVADNSSYFTFSNDFSLECWLFTWTFPTGATKYPIISKGYSSIGEFAFAVDDNGKPWFADNIASSFAQMKSTALASNSWNHIVATRSALTGYNFYVNGALTGTASYPTSGAPSHTAHEIDFGAADSVSTNVIALSEVALYERVLTATQVANHYNMGVGNLGSLVEVGYAKAASIFGNLQCPHPAQPSIAKYGSATYNSSIWD